MKITRNHLGLIIVGAIFILFSTIGIYIFFTEEKYLAHPMLYIITFFMGLEWLSTALYSLYILNKEEIK